NSGTLTVGVGVNTSASGSYTQTGGSVSLGGSIMTTDHPISIAGDIALTGAVELTASPVGGNISLGGSVTGARALTLGSGTGSISVTGAIGTNATPLTSLTINNANNTTLHDLFAASVVQNAGTGTTTFNGSVLASGASGINLVGSNFTFQNSFSTTSGPLSVTNSDTLTFEAGATGTISAALLQNSSSGNTVLSSAITAGDTVNFSGALSVVGTGSLNTQAANAPIVFSSAVTGPGDLTLVTGTGDVSFLASSGVGTALGALVITEARNVTTESMTAASITQTTGHGETKLKGNIVTSSASGINIYADTITLLGNVTANGSGPIVLNNGTLLTTTAGKTITAQGNFSQTGAGGVNLAGTISTGNQNISFASAIMLTGTTALNSGSGSGSISLSGTVDGTQALTLTAGTGDILATGVLGGTTPIGPIVVNSVHNNTIKSTTASSVSQLAGSGTTTLDGDITTNTPQGITLVGNQFVRSGAIITTNGGNFVVTNSGLITGTSINTTSIDGSYTQNGSGPVNLAGTISTNNGEISFAGPITLVAAGATLNSGSTGANITLTNTVNGAKPLTIQAGNGNITITAPLGATTGLTSLSMTGNDITVNNIGGVATDGVTGTTAITAASNINFTGTAYTANTQNYAATTRYTMAAGSAMTFTSSGDAITFSGGQLFLNTNTNLTINSSGGSITTGPIRAGPTSLRSLTLNAGSGALQVTSIGNAGNTQFASSFLTGSDITVGDIISSALTLTPSGTLFSSGNIVTTNTPLLFSSPVVLQNSNTFTTGTTGANITFNNAVNSDVAGSRILTLAAGGGDITAVAAIGGTASLNLLQIASARNATFNAITANGIVEAAGSGTTTFNGVISITDTTGIILTGTNFTVNNTINTVSGASLQVTNSGLFTFAGTGNLSGGLLQLGAGSTLLSGSVTAGQEVSFTGPVSLTGSPSIDTSSASQDIFFLNTVDGGGNLTLNANNGNINFNQNVGGVGALGNLTVTTTHNVNSKGIVATSINIPSASGTVTFNGTLNTSGSSGLTVVATNINRAGSLITTGGGNVVMKNSGILTENTANTAVISGSYTQGDTGYLGPVFLAGSITTSNHDISFGSAITLTGSSSLRTGAGPGDINLAGSVNGNNNLTLTAGSGNINIQSTLGDTTRLFNITIVSGNDVSLQAVRASSITQSNGTGTTTFNGSLDTNGATGVYIKSGDIVRGALWNASGGGGITVENSGVFTSTASGGITSSGAFLQTGAGAAILSGNIATNNSAIGFT
ncbi:MAG: S-layer family protein, partial [Verrucomicrobia bacterium]|nr:S-layer family protein [Verrucomicrobiota bacterium]